mmetsp:Transcript_2616/g.7134  ORF Transcript_2616/g.7134 Transcript_2616/m.7134 type:complete len:238 (-) Transcript_2616:1733-2446(-)
MPLDLGSRRPRLPVGCLLLGLLNLLSPQEGVLAFQLQALLRDARLGHGLSRLLLGGRGRLGGLVGDGVVPILAAAIFGALDGLLGDLNGPRGLRTGFFELDLHPLEGEVQLFDQVLIEADPGDRGNDRCIHFVRVGCVSADVVVVYVVGCVVSSGSVRDCALCLHVGGNSRRSGCAICGVVRVGIFRQLGFGCDGNLQDHLRFFVGRRGGDRVVEMVVGARMHRARAVFAGTVRMRR